MRSYFGLALLVCAGLLCAQTDQDPEVSRAKAGIDKLRALVEAGAAPRAELEMAEQKIADAEDSAVLRRTLYGTGELTEEQAEAMVAATARRVERRRQALAKAQKLVDDGVASLLSLGTYLEEFDLARRESDLAQSRADLSRQLAQMAKAEESYRQEMERAPSGEHKIAEKFDGNGIFTSTELAHVEVAFAGHFGKPLPVSANGETAVHRALGFDHRGRVDVAVHPDQPEGVWLRGYLEQHRIPYFAFRQAVPGKATGAHIHMGPISTRLARSAGGAVSGS
jgi:hypothetical protein